MKFIKAFSIAVLFSVAGIANAGGLVPPVIFLTAVPPADAGSEVHTSVEVAPGEIFTVAVNYDFGGASSVGGASDFFWDAGILTLLGFEFGPDSGDALFQVPGDIQAGQLFQIGFGNFPSLPDFGIAAFLTFQADNAGMTEITGAETLGPFQGFPEFDPTYDPLEVTVVPVPAAIWMMFGGLSALIGFARRRVLA